MKKRYKFWCSLYASLGVDESGQTLVLAAVCMIVLVGMLGLSVDAGVLRYQKRQMQNAADAAALAAALETTACGGVANCSAMRIAGQTALVENGLSGGVLVTNCAGGSTAPLQLMIGNPPCAVASDPNRGNRTYVEAVVSESVPTVFAKVLGVNAVNVAARAEATLKPAPCAYWLSQYATGASLTATNQTFQSTCPSYFGSSYSLAGSASSSGGQFYVAGPSTSSTGSVSPTPTFNYPKMPDPLLNVAAPVAGSCAAVNPSITAAATLSPGTYCGTVNVQTSATVTMNPGTYIILGSLTINGPTLTGSGVTIYFSQGNGYSYGASSIQNVNLTLSAPTSGSLQGILFFADRSLPSGQAGLSFTNWNPNSRMDGIVYLPGQEFTASNVTLEGQNYFGVVADYAAMQNSTFVPSNNYGVLANGSPFKAGGAALVQ